MVTPQDEQQLLRSGNLMPISAAAQYTPYSAEYLSLLARKRRLKSVKLGRDWLTTKEAVLEYVGEQKEKHQENLDKLNASSRMAGMERGLK